MRETLDFSRKSNNSGGPQPEGTTGSGSIADAAVHGNGHDPHENSANLPVFGRPIDPAWTGDGRRLVGAASRAANRDQADCRTMCRWRPGTGASPFRTAAIPAPRSTAGASSGAIRPPAGRLHDGPLNSLNRAVRAFLRPCSRDRSAIRARRHDQLSPIATTRTSPRKISPRRARLFQIALTRARRFC